MDFFINIHILYIWEKKWERLKFSIFFYLLLDLRLGLCEAAEVLELPIDKVWRLGSWYICWWCFCCNFCCLDRSCNPPRTESGEMGMLCGERGGEDLGKKGLYKSCNSWIPPQEEEAAAVVSIFLGSNNRSWKERQLPPSSFGSKLPKLLYTSPPQPDVLVDVAPPLPAVVVVLEVLVVVVQPLTTACRSQSSAILFLSLGWTEGGRRKKRKKKRRDRKGQKKALTFCNGERKKERNGGKKDFGGGRKWTKINYL